MSLANRRRAPHWLGFVTFIESFIFPIPADIVYIPMVFARPHRAYHYAFIATVFSALGGVTSWCIGYFSYETIAKPILEFYDKYESFQELRSGMTLEFLVILLIVSGFFHFPPIKIVTILAGVMGVHLGIFVLASVFARGGRFYFLAWLIRNFGRKVVDFLFRNLKWVVFVSCIALLSVYGILTFFLNKNFFSF
ncbi:YqaA family protein [Bartonella sp. CB178]|uniref:YqaA family protein n=1 Tax=Bartonella sp. CB178 TaxID=3112255 RepID=UPI00300DEC2D